MNAYVWAAILVGGSALIFFHKEIYRTLFGYDMRCAGPFVMFFWVVVVLMSWSLAMLAVNLDIMWICIVAFCEAAIALLWLHRHRLNDMLCSGRRRASMTTGLGSHGVPNLLRLHADLVAMQQAAAATATAAAAAASAAAASSLPPKVVPPRRRPKAPKAPKASGSQVFVSCGICGEVHGQSVERQDVPMRLQLHLVCPRCGAVTDFQRIEMRANSFPDDSEDEEAPIEMPHWWTELPAQGSSCRTVATRDVRLAVQELLDRTWKDKSTRDRGFEKVHRFEVVNVLHNKNMVLWSNYARARQAIRACAAQGLVAPEQAKTSAGGLPACLGDLDASVNEFLLFHGTKPTAADNICKSHFMVRLAGANKGTLYGPGIYFAESSSKSDEYAEDDKEGIYQGLYAMLLCRVTCGNLLVTDAGTPDTKALQRACTMPRAAYHAVLGDREKARGTFREFVIYANDQAYPEYVIIYKRVAEAETVEAQPFGSASPSGSVLGPPAAPPPVATLHASSSPSLRGKPSPDDAAEPGGDGGESRRAKGRRSRRATSAKPERTEKSKRKTLVRSGSGGPEDGEATSSAGARSTRLGRASSSHGPRLPKAKSRHSAVAAELADSEASSVGP